MARRRRRLAIFLFIDAQHPSEGQGWPTPVRELLGRGIHARVYPLRRPGRSAGHHHRHDHSRWLADRGVLQRTPAAPVAAFGNNAFALPVVLIYRSSRTALSRKEGVTQRQIGDSSTDSDESWVNACVDEGATWEKPIGLRRSIVRGASDLGPSAEDAS